MSFGSLRLGHTIKTNCINFRLLTRDMLKFYILEKGLGPVSPPYFTYNFSRRIFLMSYFPQAHVQRC